MKFLEFLNLFFVYFSNIVI